jgi:glycerophosphoryl diester phosphodiesterase
LRAVIGEVWRRVRRMKIIGHRGACAVEEENTLASFARAIADGADGIELDVRLCRSGEVVVFHDDTLERLAGRPERIDALALDEIRQVRLRRGGAIPTLDDVLTAVPPPALVNVEIKSAAAGRELRLTEKTIERVRASGTKSRVLLSSFDPFVILHARLRAPDIPVGLLFHRQMSRPLREAWAANVIRPFAAHPERVLVNAARMRRWRRRGLAVNVWTVNEPAELRRLDALGVDAVFADDPRAARAALA